MKIINLSQEEGSNEEWLAFRNYKITASRSYVLMGIDKYKHTKLKLFEDIMGLSFFCTNLDVERGTALEPEARDKLNEILGEDFSPAVVVHEKMDYFMASLDGMNSKHTAIAEFKAPNPTRPNYISRRFGSVEEFKEYLPHFYNQCQQQMSCTDIEKCYFCSFWRDELDYIVIPIDKPYIKKLEKEAKKFYEDYIVTRTPPPKQKGDYICIDDIEAIDIADKLKEVEIRRKERAKEEKEDKKVSDKLKAELAEHSDDGDFFCSGIKMTRVSTNRVDNKKLYEAYNIDDEDLEKYRVESIGFWKVSIES